MSLEYVDFDTLFGEVIVRVEGTDKGSDMITLHTKSGWVYRMFHTQDCCECVEVEDIDGDMNDLIGDVIVHAEEATDSGQDSEYGESHTWTFYRIATEKVFIVIRWLGVSNGYYSESVSLTREMINAPIKETAWSE